MKRGKNLINLEEIQREENFWNKVGEGLLSQSTLDDLKVNDPRIFLSNSTVAFSYLIHQLGNIDGLQLLDYGCGSGWLATYLAQRGAIVHGFDVSGKLVELGIKRAEANNVTQRVNLKKMMAEKLEYPDNFFDAVVGISILHHVDLVFASQELHRVLKPGAKAFFIEPLGESRLQNALRNYIFRNHHGQTREINAEHPLTYTNIKEFSLLFSHVEWQEFQLVEMIARLTGEGITNFLGVRKIDNFLLRMFPSLKKYCRLVAITYQK
jgi:2-polyprenyl-3-methyl-5-hydroxy-6-metoxy-1,4-benzoquinol methylase